MPVLLALLTTAHAGVLTVSAAGGYDFPTSEPWSGVELALHPTQTQGFAMSARLAPAWGFIEGQPLLFGEVGVHGVLPSEDATIRLGVVARVVGLHAEQGVPVGLESGLGVAPAGLASLEFEWGEQTPFTFGVRGGLGAAMYDTQCEDDADRPACLSWSTAFIGGFHARVRTPSGFAAEAQLGPVSQLSIGWAFR